MESAAEFLAEVPRITISQGKVSIDRQEPYFIENPENGEVLVIIDTTGQYTSLDGVNALALVTRTNVMIKRNERETRIFDLSGIEHFVIDRNLIHEWLQIFEKWFPIVIFPFALLFSFLYRTIQVLIYAIIGILFTKILRVKLGFRALMSISIMSITPVLILDTALDFAKMAIPFWTLLCFVIAMGFLFYGVKANAEDAFHSELGNLSAQSPTFD